MMQARMNFFELLPDLPLAKVFDKIPITTLFGSALFVCRTFRRMGKELSHARIQNEKNQVTRMARGYNLDNVTTINMLYRTLWLLRMGEGQELSHLFRSLFYVNDGYSWTFDALTDPQVNEIDLLQAQPYTLSKILFGSRDPAVLKAWCEVSQVGNGLSEYCESFMRCKAESVYRDIYLLPFRLGVPVSIRSRARFLAPGGYMPTCLGFFARSRQEVEKAKGILILMGEERAIPQGDGAPLDFESLVCPLTIRLWQNIFRNYESNTKADVEIYLHAIDSWQPTCEVPLTCPQAWLSLHQVFERLEIHVGTRDRHVTVSTYNFDRPQHKIFRYLKIHQGTLPRK